MSPAASGGVKWILVAVLFALGLATHQLAHQPAAVLLAASPTPSVVKGYAYVKQAIDGDTIELADGTRVRYLGIDTPETVHPKKKVQCYGPEASAFNHSLVDGQAVRLVRDVQDKDIYNRLLRYVYLADGTFVNEALVAGGYATVYTIPPNTARTKDLQLAQTDAKSSARGLWGKCK